jgi:hypothetical protein
MNNQRIRYYAAAADSGSIAVFPVYGRGFAPVVDVVTRFPDTRVGFKAALAKCERLNVELMGSRASESVR